MSRGFRLLFAAAALFMFAPALHAQNAVVLGSVYDGKGNPMPGIVVLLENKDTGFTRVTTTAADGTYSIPEVPPADGYKVTASTAEGETLDFRDGISVNVGDERSILPPLREKVAGVAQGEIAPGATGPGANTPTPRSQPLVRNETTSTSVGGVITGEQLRTLPLYNRNFLALGLLSPNTHDVEAGSQLTGASFSISGQRPTSNNFILDGQDNNAASSNQAIPFQVNDAIQEFRVNSSTANAEYGRGAGGVVSVVTRRGTSQMHGSAFGYFGNSALNANNPLSSYVNSGFAQAAAYAGSTNAAAALPQGSGSGLSLAAPRTYNQYVATAAKNGYCTNSIGAANANVACVNGGMGRNDMFDPAALLAANDSHATPFDSKQFGANLGGALTKKIFYFASYEGTRIDNPNAVFERVPSGFDRTIAASLTGSNDALLANKVLSLYPKANVVGVPGVLEFYKGTAPNYTNVHNALLRFDYARSNTNTYNLRYSGQLLDQLHDATLPASGAYPGNGADRKAQNQNAAFGWSHTFSPKVLNDLHLGVTQFRVTDRGQDSTFDATSLGFAHQLLPTILLSGLDTRYSGSRPGTDGAYGGWYDSFWAANPSANTAMLPSLDGSFPMARLGAPLGSPGVRRDTTWAASDNLSWSRGKHVFKFGAEFRFVQSRVVNAGYSRGVISSGDIGEFTSDSETCNSCGQAFLRPSFDYALNQQADFSGLFSAPNIAGFAQDAWRISRKITINMGGRYEFFGVPREANNQIWNYDPTANGLVQQNGKTVSDPYGYQCSTGVVPFIDAIYRAQNSFVPSWTCRNSANGGIVRPDLSDFSGRFGIAYDLFGNGSTVLRAGTGIFYDELPTSYMSQLMFNRPTSMNFADPRYIYGQNFDSGYQANGSACLQCGLGNTTVNPAALAANEQYQSAASPFGLFARDTRHSSTPYTRQSNITVQQQINRNMAIEVGYVNSGSKRLPTVNNSGYDNEWFCTNSRLQLANGNSQPYCDTFSYFPIFMMKNNGEASYNSLLVRTRIAQWHGVRANVTYTFSNSIDNASSGYLPVISTPLFTQAFGLQFYGLGNPFGFSLGRGGSFFGKAVPAIGSVGNVSGADTFAQSVTTTGTSAAVVSRYSVPQDPYNYLENDRGPSDFNTRHRVVVDWNYDIPLFHRSKWMGGWSASGILVAQSGQPFTIYSGPVFGELTQRVNAGSVALTGNPDSYIDPSTISLASASCGIATGNLYSGTSGSACIGNTKRNQFTGPNFFSFDMAMQKAFKVWGEGKELTLRSEFYNLFDRANYYNPISVYSLDGFSVNPQFGQVKSAHDPRQIQFAMRFSF